MLQIMFNVHIYKLGVVTYNVVKLISIWVRRRLLMNAFRFTDNVQHNLSRLIWDIPLYL